VSAEAAKFLNSFAQALSTMALYAPGHPARDRVVDSSYDYLRRLQEKDPRPQFSFLGLDVIYGQVALRAFNASSLRPKSPATNSKVSSRTCCRASRWVTSTVRREAPSVE
jgi:hypothetical protein